MANLDFSQVKGVVIPEGDVVKIELSGTVLWKKGITNLVPTSIDTDGSIFNGVGYKEHYRMNSSGAVVAQNSAVATGFIQAKRGDVFRITGVRFGVAVAAGVYGYISMFDANKKKIASASCDAIADIKQYVTVSPLPTSTGAVKPSTVVTIDFANGPTNMAFVRFSASIAQVNGITCSGADMIITKNEEI